MIARPRLESLPPGTDVSNAVTGRRLLVALIVLCSLAAASTAAANPWVWTKKQAEYNVRKGNLLIASACSGIGAPYRQHGLNYYYRFNCVEQFPDGSQYDLVIKPIGAKAYRTQSVTKLRGATGGVGQVYPGIGSGHWISNKTLDGSVITLEDGSKWLVSPVERYEVVIWLVVDDVTVLDGSDVFYPYRLVNTDESEVVDAKFIGY
jgi:hypothetical protein